MTDQTPDEMREAAKRLRHHAEMGTGTSPSRADAIAGADALDRLADVIEYAEQEADAANVRHWSAREESRFDAMEDVLRIARGETDEKEKEE